MMRLWLPCLLLVFQTANAQATDPLQFSKDILPILENSCVACHGADTQESGLRLDLVRAIHRGGDRGPAVVPGKPEESLLVIALTGNNDLQKMPVDGDPLTPGQVERLKRWIQEGARIPEDEPLVDGQKQSDHWAFQPRVRPTLPETIHDPWCRNPIDAFVLQRMRQQGLEPSQPAARTTLLRRVYLDLTGLPPTAEEQQQFLSDTSPGAYARLVDRLLESPHYGERWARHWLDLARYADSNGFTIDSARSIWKYRDWVIQAFNDDLPFDQFVIEQLAGDLLPDPTVDQMIATGFHRNTLINEEGGTDQEQFRVEAVVDRVNTTGSVFLGLTIGCAQCHSHKYDPITQREYYQLLAFFNNTEEYGQDTRRFRVPSPEQEKLLESIDAQLTEARAARDTYDAELLKQLPRWEAGIREAGDVAWQTMTPAALGSTQGSVLATQDDGSVFVDFTIPPNDTFLIDGGEGPGVPISAIRLEALTHDSLPNRGPGRAGNGNFVMTEFEVGFATSLTDDKSFQPLKVARAIADHAQSGYPIEHALDGDSTTGWAINVRSGSLNVDRSAVFVLAEPLLEIPADRHLVVRVRHESVKNPQYLIGRFRLSTTSVDAAQLGVTDAIRTIARKPATERSPAEQQQLEDAFKQRDANRVPLEQAVVQLEQQRDNVDRAVPTTYITRELKQPRETHIMIRGDFLRKGARVEPDVPAVLPGLSESGIANRLDLARWLVQPRNPLTARVTVNRFWQQLFGRGIVATENDFGTQGAAPTHPELLDWLSSEFIERGWSIKELHRLIVTSATYCQSSSVSVGAWEQDQDNVWLSRQSRLRLEAELLRDNCLVASGTFYPILGGPGFYPPQPEGIYALTQNKKSWPVDQGPDRYRRGMYIYFWRSSPYPFLPTFDAPNATNTCTRRSRSNTPLQALTLANDQVFVELARSLGTRLLALQPATDEQVLQSAYRICLARTPSPLEQTRLTQFVQQQREYFRQHPDDARQLVAGGTDEHSVELATWTALGRVLMNLDEFVTRE